jgi:hypothetical protein
LLAVHPFEATDDFFKRKLTATFPFVLIGMEKDVVQGENALRYAVAVDNGQTTHLRGFVCATSSTEESRGA